ncbi:hypothetical protein HY413_03115 [Candidatus Kaiserbacteria bacterium]|nr:hypothetical protein [Candidatus Kaiserbacteria bacterium]
MKLFATAIIVNVIQTFLLPFGIQSAESFAVQSGMNYLLEPTTANIVFSILPLTIIAGIAAFLYARWAKTALTVTGCVGICIVFLAVPGMMYILWWGVSFYSNPALAVEELQTIVVPMFETAQGSYIAMLYTLIPWIPVAAPFLIGPCIASFFTRSRAIAEVRFVGESEDDGVLRL